MTENEALPAPVAKTWYLYILECAGGRLYTGIAVDPESRYKAHCEGKGAKFTRSYPPSRMLMFKAYATRSEALKAEHAVKQLTPREKRKLAGIEEADIRS